MKKTFASLLIVTLIVPLCSYSPCQEKGYSLLTWKCSLPDMEWMTVTEGIDATAVVNLASAIAVAAKTDAEQLKTAANAKLDLSGNFGKVVKKAAAKGYNVTQNFFELYKTKRAGLCSMAYILKKEKLSQAQKDKAIDLYMNISEDFSKMADELKTKIDAK